MESRVGELNDDWLRTLTQEGFDDSTTETDTPSQNSDTRELKPNTSILLAGNQLTNNQSLHNVTTFFDKTSFDESIFYDAQTLPIN